jgi:hypothetical protein
MKNTDWKTTAELVWIAAIVASLTFVGIQLQQDEDVAEVEQMSSSESSAIALSQLLSDNDDVWRRGLDG